MKKSASNQLSLATASILGQAPRCIVLFMILITIGCGNSMSAIDPKKEATWNNPKNLARAIKDLDAASQWMIENAIRIVSTHPDDYSSIIMDYVGLKLAVSNVTDPGVGSIDGLPRYIIAANTINYDINLLQRNRHKNSIYEYWLIYTYSVELARMKPPRYQSIRRFLVTKTDNIKGTRKILKKSDQFFNEFSVDNKVVLSIDAENDLGIRKKLGAWETPQHFKNYPQLTHDEVILDAEGNYHLKSGSKHIRL